VTDTNQTEEMTMTTTQKRINVTTTAFEGTDFPEAEHYPEFVAEQLAERYGAEVDCSIGSSGSRSLVVLYGFDGEERDIQHEVESLLKVDLWDEFCDHGYKAYS
jgi:hypothetical protein